MPRIYDENDNPLDYCRKHFPKEEDVSSFENLTGSTYRGYDSEHPNYENDPNFYRCEICK